MNKILKNQNIEKIIKFNIINYQSSEMNRERLSQQLPWATHGESTLVSQDHTYDGCFGAMLWAPRADFPLDLELM